MEQRVSAETVQKETFMTRFMSWLTDEAHGWTMLGYIVFSALVVVSLDYTIQAALVNWGFVKAPPPIKAEDWPLLYINPVMLFTIFV